MKTNWKKVGTVAGWVFLAGAGLAIADLVFEGNTIEGVQVIAGKDSSTGKSLVPKVDPVTGGLVVSGTITASTTGLATSAKQDTGNTSLSSIDGKTPGKCSNQWITTIDTTSGADTSLALTGCVSGTCKRVVVDNVGSNPVLIQVNSSAGTAGLWLAGATAHPEMQHSADLSFGPAVTAIYKSTTGATAPAAYGTIGDSETVVTACD